MMESKLKEWGFPGERMFLAAGPCSAESCEQVLETAHALKNCGVGFLRAGIWKPRTRPGGFEGVGLKGLAWLDRARTETGLKVGTEVAEPAHAEACLEFGMDVIWLGARTTTNPFSVQAVADVLRGTNVPVLVKNPMSSDLGLWLGAIERLSNAGIQRIGAIHRGFSSSLEMRYRNAPDWRVPIEFKRLMPEIPLLCDPSHIAGRAALVPGIAQEAMDLLFDGLMVEVHCNPTKALSDAAQQLTPAQFIAMVAGIELSQERGGSTEFIAELSQLRERVDVLDSQLLDLLAQRMEVVRAMGSLKAAQHISTLQPDRWRQIVEDRVRKGGRLALSEGFVLQLMQAVHEEAIRQQEVHRIASVPKID